MFDKKCIDCKKWFKTSHRSDKRCRSCYKTWHKRKVYYTTSKGRVRRVKPLKKKKNYQKKVQKRIKKGKNIGWGW